MDLMIDVALFKLHFGYKAAILLLLAVMLTFVANLIFRYLSKKSKKTKNILDDVIIQSIRAPAHGFIWFFFLYYLIGILENSSILALKQWLKVFPLLLFVWIAFRFINSTEEIIGKSSSKLNSDSIRLATRVMKLFIILLASLTVAQYFGLSVTSILTFGGMGGIIVGFAAKDMLSNIFGGLMLQIDKPFNTGDWIRSKEYGFEGIVEKIGWRMTRVITFSKNPVYVPNSIFTTIPVETPSRMTNRRIKETIGVRYEDIGVLGLIVSDIRGFLEKHEDIDKKQTLIVNLNQFSAYSVDFFIYTFTKTKNWQKFHVIKQDVLLEVSSIIAKHGAEIAYPTEINNIITKNSELNVP